jgi:hypothetical protein
VLEHIDVTAHAFIDEQLDQLAFRGPKASPLEGGNGVSDSCFLRR